MRHIYTNMVISFDTSIMVDVSKLFHKGLNHCLIIKTIAASTAQTRTETSRDNGEYCIFQTKEGPKVRTQKGIWYTWKWGKKEKERVNTFLTQQLLKPEFWKTLKTWLLTESVLSCSAFGCTS